jgi:ubiquitin thioesterase OTU1
MISLKLSSVNGQQRISIDSNQTTFLDFLKLVSKETSLPIEKIQISSGYPPAVICSKSDDLVSSITTISSGSVILVKDGPSPSLIETANEGIEHLMLMGFSRPTCRHALLVACNDVNSAVEICQVSPRSIEETRRITRYIIDADNSCMFNALGYLIKKDKSKTGSLYREIIADTIRSDDTYSADILGQPIEDYAKWILNPDKWGGEIEMSILANHLHIEIAAIDIETGHLYIYGEGMKFNSRVYLLYDGIHYDAIISEKTSEDNQPDEKDDITIFYSSDTLVVKQVEILASELRKKKQFVNMVRMWNP